MPNWKWHQIIRPENSIENPSEKLMKSQFSIHRHCGCCLPNNIQRPHNWFSGKMCTNFVFFFCLFWTEICMCFSIVAILQIEFSRYWNGIYLIIHRRKPTHTNLRNLLHVHNILLMFGVCMCVYLCVPFCHIMNCNPNCNWTNRSSTVQFTVCSKCNMCLLISYQNLNSFFCFFLVTSIRNSQKWILFRFLFYYKYSIENRKLLHTREEEEEE